MGPLQTHGGSRPPGTEAGQTDGLWMWEGGEDSEPLLLFEELVSLPRWDRCKLMGVLALRAQKRDRPTACPASVYARRDSEPLLLFEELVSLLRWDRCKLMEVLTTQT